MSEPKLVRQLGLFDATMIMVGIVIGSGIYLSTGIIAASIPSAGLIWLLEKHSNRHPCQRGADRTDQWHRP